jgi:hypothetical protein
MGNTIANDVSVFNSVFIVLLGLILTWQPDQAQYADQVHPAALEMHFQVDLVVHPSIIPNHFLSPAASIRPSAYRRLHQMYHVPIWLPVLSARRL